MTYHRLLPARSALLLVPVVLAVILAACGAEESPATSTPEATPTAVSDASVDVNRFCRPPGQFSPEPYNLQVEARWRGKDRIVIKGEVTLPGPADLRYYVCQNGQVATFLRPVKKPGLEDGKIDLESRVVEDAPSLVPGPPLDPNGRFEVVLAAVGVTGVPFFIATIPVEGAPR